ncbi:unnamed protein product [Adineta ricciae]|uniref:TTF-type domain-containing protein n=1 Tax=Adineta ricciae TaxID=249248 RepID=A0A815Z279_ADIRI|nr:unnamed protein product [Adineta ricciae]CAF1578370.1 unnamed protein product [Adineta ricciae]
MDQFSKLPKRGTIQSFFNSYSTNNRKSNSSVTDNTSDSHSDERIKTVSRSVDSEQQQDQISLHSPSSSSRILSPLQNCSTSSNKEENVCLFSSESPALLSPSNKRRQDQTSLSSPKSPRLVSPSSRSSQFVSASPSSKQQQLTSSAAGPDVLLISPIQRQQEQTDLSLSKCSSSLLSSSNKSQLYPFDLSNSLNEPPAQPKLATYPFDKDKRCFHSQWFLQFSWLEYSVQTDFAYCYYCRHFNSSARLNTRNQSDAFVNGFHSWKNAFSKKQGFSKHELSQSHKQAVVNFEEYVLRKKSSSNVIQVLDRSRNQVIEQNRTKLKKIISLLHLCARQMIALRGHVEDASSTNRGNFIELLKWSSSTDPVVSSILNDSAKNSTYLSPQIQNEMISLVASNIRQQITTKIKECMFSLMVDESRDISGNEQLSVVVRVIDLEVTANKDNLYRSTLFKEYFLGFIKLVEFDAQSLTDEIVKFLSSINVDLQNCIAMCFDGASVLSGIHSGVQALLRQQFIPRAIYVHCYAHKLNLVICDVTKAIPYLSEFYSIVNKIYTYFHKSSVTNETFKKVQQQLKIDCSILSNSTTIKNWAETRWDSRWTSIQSIIDNYRVLKQSLEELENEGSDRSIDARGLLLGIREPLFIVTLFIIQQLFGKIKILSDQLKCKISHSTTSKSLDFGKAHSLISDIINQINELRSKEEFSRLFEQIAEFCDVNDVDFNVPAKHRRTKTLSTRFKDCVVMSTIGQRENISSVDEFRDRVFYPVIDAILIEMNDRFSNSNLEIIRGISSLSPDSSQFLEIEELTHLCNMLQCDGQLLKNEIQVLKPMLKEPKLKDIVDLYFEVLPYKQAFPTVISLLVGALTIPVSSATTERTFSKMKFIKTAARNSMTDTRLSDLSIIAIERDFDVDYEQIVDTFAIEHKNSRILLK